MLSESALFAIEQKHLDCTPDCRPLAKQQYLKQSPFRTLKTFKYFSPLKKFGLILSIDMLMSSVSRMSIIFRIEHKRMEKNHGKNQGGYY